MSTILVEPPPSAVRSPPTDDGTTDTGTAFPPTPTDTVVPQEAAAERTPMPSTPLPAAIEASPSESAAVTESHTSNTTTNNDVASPKPIEKTPLPPRVGTTRQSQLARAQQRLAVQLQFAENARRKIADETHPDLHSRLTVLARERDALLTQATQHAAYLRHTTAVLFAYECEEATSEFELSCEKLRTDMLDEIHHEMEIIQDQRTGGGGGGASSSDCEGVWLLWLLALGTGAPDGLTDTVILLFVCSTYDDAQDAEYACKDQREGTDDFSRWRWRRRDARPPV